jgi:hypothetical protein
MAYSTLILIVLLSLLSLDIFNQISPLVASAGDATNVFLTITVFISLALLLISSKLKWKQNIPPKALLILKLYWFWCLITFLHGVQSAQDYWDWKMLLLGYLPSVLLTLTVVLGISFNFSSKLIRFLLTKLFPLSFLLVPFTLAFTDELYARVVAPVCIFILISPYLKKNLQLLVIAVAITSISLDVTYRANAIRLVIPLILVVVFYYVPLLRTKLLNVTLVMLFALPLVLLELGISGQFNIFAENKFDFEVNTTLQGTNDTSNVSADTRTFLYVEVFRSMNKRDSSYLTGEGATAGYETDYFLDATLNQKGRYGSEVGFLNMVMRSGAIGVLLYALMLFVPAYYAINQSNNRLVKMLGLFLATRWLLYFVEDMALVDMNYFFLWLTMGLCLSNKFRAMSDLQIKQFFTRTINASRHYPPLRKMQSNSSRFKQSVVNHVRN